MIRSIIRITLALTTDIFVLLASIATAEDLHLDGFSKFAWIFAIQFCFIWILYDIVNPQCDVDATERELDDGH